MSKRLQVVVPDDELHAYEAAAETLGLTLSAWARQSLRRAQQEVASGDVDSKLQSIRAAYAHSFPTAGIETMLGEIEKGYVVETD